MIEELKRALGAGSRPNQYLLEIAYGDLDSEKLSILCKEASLPEYKISTVTAAYHGRKIVLRGETEYPETYEITVYDDASMSLRRFFAKWLLTVDDPGKHKTKLTDTVSGSKGFLGQLVENVEGIVDRVEEEINDLKDLPGRITQTVTDWALGYVGIGGGGASMDFATEIKIWTLDHAGAKVHGYELENAYPIGLSAVDLSAEKQNEVIEYTVTFAFSDFFIIK